MRGVYHCGVHASASRGQSPKLTLVLVSSIWQYALAFVLSPEKWSVRSSAWLQPDADNTKQHLLMYLILLDMIWMFTMCLCHTLRRISCHHLSLHIVYYHS